MSRGGSRFGAGRPAFNVKAERCIRLDVRQLHRVGSLAPGAHRSWGWNMAGEPAGNVGLRAELHALWVLCSINGKAADQRITIERTGCTYGGVRPWFLCPPCNRRVAVLYLRGQAFRCRRCAKVAYFSQSEDACDRRRRRLTTVAAKLPEDGSKPKGMHWTTFKRLQAEIDRHRARHDAAFVETALRLFPHLLD